MVNGPAGARDREAATARRLADSYAVAWRDSFLLRQVDWFTAAPPDRRAAKIAADSVRRAGVAAFSSRGPAAAIRIWRRALARSAAAGDTAGIGAALGNIGAGLARLGRLDSATTYLERARDRSVSMGDRRTEANAVSELAGVSERRDDLAGARSGYARALALHQRFGDSRGLAADYNNLGLLAERVGDLMEARRQFEAALAQNRKDGRDQTAATNLVNLADLAAQAGEFTRAESWYREALDIWRRQAQGADIADVHRGLGLLELRRGDYRAARIELAEARTGYERAELSEDALAMGQQLSAVLAATGELQGALDGLHAVERISDSVHASPTLRARIALARADLSVQLNRHADAKRFFATAEALFRRAGDRAGEAEAQQGRGTLMIDEEDGGRGRSLLDAVLRNQLALGNVRGAALTRLSLGRARGLAGDPAGARRTIAAAVADLRRLGDPIATAAALGEAASLEAEDRSPAAAESLYVAALALVGARSAPEISWRLHAGLGAVRRTMGATEEAARELRASIADIERTGRSLSLAERRSGFLLDKADVFLELALLEGGRGRIDDAFATSEKIRAREMLELLARGRVAVPTDTPAELVEQEQDLRRRIDELSREIERGASGSQALRGPGPGGTTAVSREALVRAQREYGELLLEMRERAPRHTSLVSPEAATRRDVAQRLGPGDAFVEYLLSEAGSIAFVITHDTAAVVELHADRRAVARLVDFVRGTLQPRGSPRLDSLWRSPLRQLRQVLIVPLEDAGLLAGKTRLTIVPHLELHYLPFAALVDGAGRFLVQQYELVIAPSASVWLALMSRPAGRSAAGGVLALAPRPEALPASRREVEAIARLGDPATRTLIGAAATEEAFRREAPARRVVHLATVGVLNQQNPLFSFVQLASSPAADGRLEVHEVFGLSLTAELVVLSACQTLLASGALTDVPSGDDWVGLARAFLHAGAARVLASLWAVEDDATALLMERFYAEYQSGSPPAAALAAAQRALLSVPATSHPYHWAGFELIGVR
jgi:CHAT domain-containing protein